MVKVVEVKPRVVVEVIVVDRLVGALVMFIDVVHDSIQSAVFEETHV